MLNDLFRIQNRIAAGISTTFKRSLYGTINWEKRLVVLKGGRGTGKTTLVFQHYLEQYGDVTKCLYISADNPLVLKHGIYHTAETYFKYHGECLIIDEVHKQKDWSIEVKALYDAYPDKRFIVLGSSALSLLSEKGDLSRRSVIYTLPILSFREFLALKHKQNLELFSFLDLIRNHTTIAGEVSNQFSPILGQFRDYLTGGSYPFFLESNREEYLNTLANVVDKVIYEDIPTIKALRAFSSLKLKKLLAHLATSSIPVFNIESLKSDIGVSKDTLYEYFDLLDRAEIINIVRTETKNMKAFKHSKILYKSPNIYYAIAYDFWHTSIDKGNVRESYFASQVPDRYTLYSSAMTDFTIVDGDEQYHIEVGGRSKKKKQLANLENAYVFKDDIEIGIGNSIPLYLIGFLY
jgi:predicted AAA+ superfamily ATPase